jgi:hypothetical protein
MIVGEAVKEGDRAGPTVAAETVGYADAVAGEIIVRAEAVVAVMFVEPRGT